MDKLLNAIKKLKDYGFDGAERIEIYGDGSTVIYDTRTQKEEHFDNINEAIEYLGKC